MSMSDYAESAVLNLFLRGVAFSAPAAVYVSLHTADPGEAGSLAAEVSGNGYARQVVSFGAPGAGTGTSSQVANTGDVLFPVATGNWGLLTHVSICDALTGGNVLWSGALTTPQNIGNLSQFKIPTGSLKVSLD